MKNFHATIKEIIELVEKHQKHSPTLQFNLGILLLEADRYDEVGLWQKAADLLSTELAKETGQWVATVQEIFNHGT